MNKRKIILKIILIIFCYLLTITIQILGLCFEPMLSVESFTIFSLSSSIPFTIAVCLACSMIPDKLKVIKYILYCYVTFLIIMFIIVIIFAVTTGLVETNGGIAPNI